MAMQRAMKRKLLEGVIYAGCLGVVGAGCLDLYNHYFADTGKGAEARKEYGGHADSAFHILAISAGASIASYVSLRKMRERV